jgi:hypothetical protein
MVFRSGYSQVWETVFLICSSSPTHPSDSKVHWARKPGNPPITGGKLQETNDSECFAVSLGVFHPPYPHTCARWFGSRRWMRAPREWHRRAHPRTHCRNTDSLLTGVGRSFQTSRSPPPFPSRPGGSGPEALASPIEVLWASDGHQAVGVCEFGKTTDLTVVLERRSDRHERGWGAARLRVLGRQIHSGAGSTSLASSNPALSGPSDARACGRIPPGSPAPSPLALRPGTDFCRPESQQLTKRLQCLHAATTSPVTSFPFPPPPRPASGSAQEPGGAAGHSSPTLWEDSMVTRWLRPTPPPARFLALGFWLHLLVGLFRRNNQSNLRLGKWKDEEMRNRCCLVGAGLIGGLYLPSKDGKRADLRKRIITPRPRGRKWESGPVARVKGWRLKFGIEINQETRIKWLEEA